MAHITQVTQQQAQSLQEELIRLLQNVVDDGASIGFLPPLAYEEAASYWDKIQADLAGDGRVLFVARDDGGALLGCVQLGLETRSNGNHRAEVQKLMVHTSARRQGIGRQLMQAAEEYMRTNQRSLLVLDTRQGDPSERLYQGMGYTLAGIIPAYARSADGSLDATAFYYKSLDSI